MAASFADAPLASVIVVSTGRRLVLWSAITVVLAGCQSTGESPRRDAIRERVASLSSSSSPSGRSSSTAEATPTVPRSRAEVVAEVLRANPSLAAAQTSVRAALARADITTAQPDPMVRAQVAPLSVVTPFIGGAPFGGSLTLAQKVVWPQKLHLAGASALADAEVGLEALAEARLDLAATASLLYDDYWAVARAIEVQRDIIDLSRQNEATAAAGYGAGRGSQQDPLEAEVERIHAEHQLHVQENQLVATRARLNALMHRPSAAPLPIPTAPSFLPEEIDSPPTPTSTTSPHHHPAVRVWEAREAAATSRQALTDWRFLPDVEVNASYNSMWPALPHQLMVGVAFDVPLQLGARDAEVAVAEANLHVAQASLAAAADVVAEKVTVASSAMDEARRVERLLREQLLPSATNRAHAALAGYEQGENAFETVMRAERLRYDVRLQLIAATADVSRSHARLLQALGAFPGVNDEDRSTNNPPPNPVAASPSSSKNHGGVR